MESAVGQQELQDLECHLHGFVLSSALQDLGYLRYVNQSVTHLMLLPTDILRHTGSV